MHQCTISGKGKREKISVCGGWGCRTRKFKLQGELGCWWMPQKPSKYPPIHDQIDTPADFNVAVRKWWAAERSRAETGWASGGETGRSNPQQQHNKSEHTPLQNLLTCERARQSTRWQRHGENCSYNGWNRLCKFVKQSVCEETGWVVLSRAQLRSAGFNVHTPSFTTHK